MYLQIIPYWSFRYHWHLLFALRAQIECYSANSLVILTQEPWHQLRNSSHWIMNEPVSGPRQIQNWTLSADVTSLVLLIMWKSLVRFRRTLVNIRTPSPEWGILAYLKDGQNHQKDLLSPVNSPEALHWRCLVVLLLPI